MVRVVFIWVENLEVGLRGVRFFFIVIMILQLNVSVLILRVIVRRFLILVFLFVSFIMLVSLFVFRLKEVQVEVVKVSYFCVSLRILMCFILLRRCLYGMYVFMVRILVRVGDIIQVRMIFLIIGQFMGRFFVREVLMRVFIIVCVVDIGFFQRLVNVIVIVELKRISLMVIGFMFLVSLFIVLDIFELLRKVFRNMKILMRSMVFLKLSILEFMVVLMVFVLLFVFIVYVMKIVVVISIIGIFIVYCVYIVYVVQRSVLYLKIFLISFENQYFVVCFQVNYWQFGLQFFKYLFGVFVEV